MQNFWTSIQESNLDFDKKKRLYTTSRMEKKSGFNVSYKTESV